MVALNRWFPETLLSIRSSTKQSLQKQKLTNPKPENLQNSSSLTDSIALTDIALIDSFFKQLSTFHIAHNFRTSFH